MKYEEADVDGVDHSIFDTVALPELPVDHDHPLDHVDAETAAAMAAANIGVGVMPEPATVQYATGTVPTLPHAPEEGLHMAAVGYNPLQNEVRRSMPMPEVIIPPKWLSRYEELKQYKEMHGVTPCLSDPQNKQLNAWIRTQKQQYKMLQEGKPSHMSQLRIDLLNEIGFEWAGEKRDKFWHDRYHELVAFRAKHGTSRVPEKYDAAPQLHTWVSLQRRQLKIYKEGRTTKLTDERIRLLHEVGLESNIRNSSSWMDRFMELKRYKDEHGDCDVPQKWKVNPSLGRWVDNQKTQHQKLYDGKPTHLTIERIQLLVSIGFIWRVKNTGNC